MLSSSSSTLYTLSFMLTDWVLLWKMALVLCQVHQPLSMGLMSWLFLLYALPPQFSLTCGWIRPHLITLQLRVHFGMLYKCVCVCVYKYGHAVIKLSKLHSPIPTIKRFAEITFPLLSTTSFTFKKERSTRKEELGVNFQNPNIPLCLLNKN